MNINPATPAAAKNPPALRLLQARVNTDRQRPNYLRARRALPDGAGQPLVVSVRREELVIPTYMPAAPDKNPMFLEKRVYQGSSGKVYPLPVTDRISQTKTNRRWKVVWLENEFLRVMILPEIGGRIHAILDKTNGCDLIYNQPVIKPALVGLAGPWISGGIEFNWPQHHRPATFLPTDYQIERSADGSITVWCGDHDPMTRMKGMHGACLHPGKAFLELKVRAYNRTPFVQTFLWWANAGIRVHEAYQSFFPTDVHCVADHARRSMSEYPLAQGHYYGVNYNDRRRAGVPVSEVPRQFVPPHCGNGKVADDKVRIPDCAPNDLSFYANIPTPCSYMCVGSTEDFFGGYDYKTQSGVIHVADHHISPGKKQWTWGNHEFGYAWDRNLTDADADGTYRPYIELMAGVYTDNQPDFSFLGPGETRTWSQFWYPIQKIGPAKKANVDAALNLEISRGKARLGVSVTSFMAAARIQLAARNQIIFRRDCSLAPGQPFITEIGLPRGVKDSAVRASIFAADGREIISYQSCAPKTTKTPLPATEPLPPIRIASADELFITGLHLEQYRHATRCPTDYWREALRRDPFDARCNNAMGLWRLRRGEFPAAEAHFRMAIQRLTIRNANPYDGEAYYNLGCCLRYQTKLDDAYDAFAKAAWNQAWVPAACHALAELDCVNQKWSQALEHLDRSLRYNSENTQARNLKVMVLRRIASANEAESLLRETLALDPLDWWARHLAGQTLDCDWQVALDLAHDHARAGFYAEAIGLLTSLAPGRRDLPDQSLGAEPMVQYTLGWLCEKAARSGETARHYQIASQLPPEYCHPARLEEISILDAARRRNPDDARAPYYLGNLLYDRRRHEEAIRLWERSARLEPSFATVWRNLGVGFFNVLHKPAKARIFYDLAFLENPDDARVLFERDQLWKRMGEKAEKRLRELTRHAALVNQRDDLSMELCSLHNQTGRPEKALELLQSRHFQPWEGGEGGPLGQYARSHVALGRAALASDEAESALAHFEAALAAPENLGEARHILANDSDIQYWLGRAAAALGDHKRARACWNAAANFKGDFQEMSVRDFSEMTYYSALAWKELGRAQKASSLLRQLLSFAQKLEKTRAKMDYFATSLPALLLFDDDLQQRHEIRSLFLQAQAWLGLGRVNKARALLAKVLRRDPHHALAADLLAEIGS